MKPLHTQVSLVHIPKPARFLIETWLLSLSDADLVTSGFQAAESAFLIVGLEFRNTPGHCKIVRPRLPMKRFDTCFGQMPSTSSTRKEGEGLMHQEGLEENFQRFATNLGIAPPVHFFCLKKPCIPRTWRDEHVAGLWVGALVCSHPPEEFGTFRYA